jgi:hypothetical protein
VDADIKEIGYGYQIKVAQNALITLHYGGDSEVLGYITGERFVGRLSIYQLFSNYSALWICVFKHTTLTYITQIPLQASLFLIVV